MQTRSNIGLFNPEAKQTKLLTPKTNKMKTSHNKSARKQFLADLAKETSYKATVLNPKYWTNDRPENYVIVNSQF